MSYRIEASETVSHALRRIAGEQIGKALGEIDDADLDVEGTVHQVRKRCKKLRGLLRLVRPDFVQDYSKENERFRDLARLLSSSRDARVVVQTLDEVLDEQSRLSKEDAAELRERFRSAVAPTEEEGAAERRLSVVRDALELAAEDVQTWAVEPEAEGLCPAGFVKTYGRGRKAMGEAMDSGGSLDWHEWRKRAKYHWYHVRLLRNVWPKVMKAMEKETDRLSDLLGDEHDLSVLRASVGEWDQTGASSAAVGAVLETAELKQRGLRLEAAKLGQRVFAEPKKAMGKRMQGYWQAMRSPAYEMDSGADSCDGASKPARSEAVGAVKD